MAKIIYAISDSLGETAESVARATASQYDKETIDIVFIHEGNLHRKGI